ncbi:MAG: hypothetical protein JSU63_13020 [Phycisphaerales bacterium]|nr:MAG: hypothetical protein JSU63_13020 [Phycisphaerales bacterium]
MDQRQASNTTHPPADGGQAAREYGAVGRWLSLLAVYIVFLGLTEAKLWRPDTLYIGAANVQIAEAQAWWNGQLDLPERWHDTALVDGKVYSHFPLMFSLVSAALVPMLGGVPHWFVVLVVLTVPFLIYELFRSLLKSPVWSAVIAIGYLCGTSTWRVLEQTIRTCSPYYVNITLAGIGLTILLMELYGRKRVWVAGLGLIIATLSRQLTVAFALPLAFMALRGCPAEKRRSRSVALAVVGVIVVGLPLVSNTLKFGHPLQTGYKLIYEGREDNFAQDALTHGIFSPQFVPRNLYYTNIGLPRFHRITMAGEEQVHIRPNTVCTGIWWTTPLLLWLFIDLRRILAEPVGRWLLLGALVVYAALLFFHATGAYQRGYNRFSLDYMLVLFAVIAPTCFVGRRRWISVVMIGWSVVYFRWLI